MAGSGCVTLSRPLDARLTAAGSEAESRPAEALGEEMARSIVRAVAMAVGTLVEAGFPPVILTSAPARAVLKDLTRADLPRLVVLSQREIPRDTPDRDPGQRDRGGARSRDDILDRPRP